MFYISQFDDISITVHQKDADILEQAFERWGIRHDDPTYNTKDQEEFGYPAKVTYKGIRPAKIGMTREWHDFGFWLCTSRPLFELHWGDSKFNNK